MGADNINSVTLTGNLTRDPELRQLPGGASLASLRLAVNRREKQDGDWTDRANFFDVTVWGRQAESCVQYLEKGRPIAVQGRLRWREWESSDGTKRQAVEVVADNVQFLNAREGDAPAPRQQQPVSDLPADQAGLEAAHPQPTATASRADDDIPF